MIVAEWRRETRAGDSEQLVGDGGQTPVMGEAEQAAARELSLRGVRPPVNENKGAREPPYSRN